MWWSTKVNRVCGGQRKLIEYVVVVVGKYEKLIDNSTFLQYHIDTVSNFLLAASANPNMSSTYVFLLKISASIGYPSSLILAVFCNANMAIVPNGLSPNGIRVRACLFFNAFFLSRDDDNPRRVN